MSSEEVADEWATRNPAVPTLYGFDSSCSTSFLPCFSREGCAPTDPAELRRAQNKDAAARAVAKGVERMKNKQNLGAIQAFNEALSYDEHYADAYVARAATLANDGKFEPAVGDLERALAIDCEHQNARQYIVTTLLAWGNSLKENGDVKGARDKYQKVLVYEEDARAKKALEDIDTTRKDLKRRRSSLGSKEASLGRNGEAVEDKKRRAENAARLKEMEEFIARLKK